MDRFTYKPLRWIISMISSEHKRRKRRRQDLPTNQKMVLGQAFPPEKRK
jgi:hypothetical protein